MANILIRGRTYQFGGHINYGDRFSEQRRDFDREAWRHAISSRMDEQYHADITSSEPVFW